eukprot:scaffold327398_cov43-Prasinocladus_malaysianus.AAC.1
MPAKIPPVPTHYGICAKDTRAPAFDHFMRSLGLPLAHQHMPPEPGDAGSVYYVTADDLPEQSPLQKHLRCVVLKAVRMNVNQAEQVRSAHNSSISITERECALKRSVCCALLKRIAYERGRDLELWSFQVVKSAAGG